MPHERMGVTDVLVIGAGPAGYAFARSLGPKKRITVIAPSAAKKCANGVHSKTFRSPKLRQPAVAGNMEGWRTGAPAKINLQPAFSYIGLHGWGGAAQHWGASLGIFEPRDIRRNGFDPPQFEAAYAECAKFVPIAGNEDDALRSRYGAFPESASTPRSARIRRLDGRHCEGKVLVGAPRVAVHTTGANACVGCNRCLSGCRHHSIWYPGRREFEDLGEHVATLDGLVVELKPHAQSCDVVVQTSTGLKTLNARTVVLACGPLMTFILLAKLVEKPFFKVGRREREKPFCARTAVFSPGRNFVWPRALSGMLSTLTNFRALATLALCIGASFLGAFLAARGAEQARSYPSNRVERRQVVLQRPDRSQLPAPVKALSAPDTPINVLAANLDAAERAEMPAMAPPRNHVLTGSRGHLERRIAKLE